MLKNTWLGVYTAIVASIVLSVLDSAVLLIRYPQSINSIRDLILFYGYSLCIFIIFGVVFGTAQTLVGLLAQLVRKTVAWFTKTERPLYTPLSYGLISLPAIIYTSILLFRGKGIARYPLIVSAGPWLATLILFLCVGTVTVIAISLCKSFSHVSGRGSVVKLLLLAVVGCLFAGCYSADALLYVGLYGYIHLALMIVAFLLLELFVFLIYLWRQQGRAIGRARSISAAVLAGSALIGAYVIYPYWCQRAEFKLLANERMVAEAKLFKVARFVTRRDYSEDILEQLTGITVSYPAPITKAGPWKCVSKNSEGMNILIVTVDAFRADHCGAYGYSRGNTPNITGFAKGSYLFRNSFSVSSNTQSSLLPLFEAKLAHNLKGLTRATNSPIQQFYDNGYKTIAVNVGDEYFHCTSEFNSYFDLTPQGKSDEGITVTDSDKTEIALGELNKHKRDKFLMWIDYTTPHGPYYPPEGFRRFGTNLLDRYDGELAYVDSEFGKLIKGLSELQLDKNTIVVLTADHGEEFGDHGGLAHSATLYNELVKVPLIIRVPGQPGRSIDNEVSCIDLFPTLMNLTGVTPARDMDGVSLAPLMLEKDHCPRESVYCQHTDPGGNIFKEALIKNGWKLIRTVDGNIYELYNLRSDPHERKNLIGMKTEIAEGMKDTLKSYTYQLYVERFADKPVDEQAASRLITVLMDGRSTAGKKIALRMLGDSSSEAIAEAVANILAGTEPVELKMEAVRWLEKMAKKDKSSVRDAAVRSFHSALKSESDNWLKAEIISALCSMQGEFDGEKLYPYLFDESPLVREAAVKALSSVRLENTEEVLLEILRKDDSDQVVSAAAAMLGKLKSKRAVDYLIPIAERDGNLLPRIQAIRALGEIGEPKSVPVLLSCIRNCPESNIQSQAVSALGKLGDRLCIPALEEMLPYTNNYVRKAIWEALGQLSDKRDGEGLVEFSRYAYFPWQELASIQAMERAGGFDIFLYLANRVSEHSERKIHQRRVQALRVVAENLAWAEYAPWLSRGTVDEITVLLESASEKSDDREKEKLLKVREIFNSQTGDVSPVSLSAEEIIEELRQEQEKWKRRELYRRFYEACKASRDECGPFPPNLLKDCFLKGNDPDFCRFCVSALKETDKKEIASFLIEIIQDNTGERDLVLKKETVLALGAICGSDELPVLIKLMMDSPEIVLRHAAVEALALSGHPEAIKTLLNFLNKGIQDYGNAEKELSYTVIEELVSSGKRETFLELTELMAKGLLDYESRIVLCKSMANLAGMEDGELLVKYYDLVRLEEPIMLTAGGLQEAGEEDVFLFVSREPAAHINENVRHAFINLLYTTCEKVNWEELDQWLSRQTREEIAAGLERAMSKEDGHWLKLLEIVNATYRMKIPLDDVPPVTLSQLLEAFTEEQPAWRQSEIARRFQEVEEPLGESERTEATEVIMGRFATVENDRYKRNCVKALGNLRGEAALEFLSRIISSGDDSKLLTEAVIALGKTGRGGSVATLINLCEKTESRSIKRASIEALGYTGSKEPIGFLVDKLRKKPDMNIRISSCKSLGRLLGDGDMDTLLECAELGKFKDPIVCLIEGLPNNGGYKIMKLLVNRCLKRGNERIRKASSRTIRKIFKKEKTRSTIAGLPQDEKDKLLQKMKMGMEDWPGG